MANQLPPKAFVSYSWSNPEHQSWVLHFATRLRESFVDVIIDKWHLRAGDDLHHFMESMVSDKSIRFVLLICDDTYSTKADERRGGAGAETQIVSSEIYNSTTQSKFLPIVRTKREDGTPCLPAYLKSRVYFDFSDDSNFAAEFERLLRHIHNRPAHSPPPIGAMPNFLTSDTSISGAASLATRALRDSVYQGKGNVSAIARECFRLLSYDLSKLIISTESDEDSWQAIQGSRHLRDEYISACELLFECGGGTLAVEMVKSSFENYFTTLLSPQTATSVQTEPVRFFFHELLIHFTSLCMRKGEFSAIASLCDEKFSRDRGAGREWVNCFAVDSSLSSIQGVRQERMRTSRISVKADLLQERASGSGANFEQLHQADVVLAIQSILGASTGKTRPIWKPWTAVFCHPIAAETLPFFGKAIAKRDYTGFDELFDVVNTNELWHKLKPALAATGADKWRFNYEPIGWESLIGIRNSLS